MPTYTPVARLLVAGIVSALLSGVAWASPPILLFDIGNWWGYSSSLALLPNGLPAVASDGYGERYAWFDGGTWQATVVESGSCRGAGLAILPSGRPALAYVKTATDELRYSEFDGSAWHCTTVLSGVEIYDSPVLAVLPDGTPVMVYVEQASHQLVYACRDGTSWQHTVVDAGSSCRPSLFVLPSGAPAVAYSSGGRVRYAWLEEGVWQTSDVADIGADYVSLALGPSGQPAIAHSIWWNTYQLSYAEFNGATWTDSLVAAGGWACALGFNAGGDPVIGHMDPEANMLKCSWRVDGLWLTTELDSCWTYMLGMVRLTSGHLLLSYNAEWPERLRLAAICGAPQTLYVNPTAGNDLWDGLAGEWDGTHGPKATIGTAMGQAWHLDEVVLAPGTYTGPGNRDLSYFGRQITVRGSDPNDPATVAATVIDCAASPTDRHRAFSFPGGEGPQATLRAVTIRNGCAPLTQIVEHPWWNISLGGAVFGRATSPTIADCVFQRNQAQLGGAVCIDAPDGATSNPLITRCWFEANSVVAFVSNWGPGGGALCCSDGTAKISNCHFAGNTARHDGNWICSSGAIDLTDITAEVVRCQFVNNTADPRGAGGAAGIWGWDVPTQCVFTDCHFVGNHASGVEDEFDFQGGGAIYAYRDCSVTLVNNILDGNSSAMHGGGVYLYGEATLTVRNSTITATTAGSGLGHVVYGGQARDFTNCIIWNGADWGCPAATVRYSVVEGGWPGVGNTGGEPRFYDPDGPDHIFGTIDDDLRLRSGSAAIDAGDNDAVPADTFDLDGDGDTTEPLPWDLDNAPRFVDDPVAIPDPGHGTPPIIDIGAYEYQADCNQNGQIDSVDIVVGSSPDCDQNGVPDECQPDCNTNGVADPCDIADGTSTDCNANELPDDCEPWVDCNGNGIFDACELGTPGHTDCNANGTLDECDIAWGGSEDCDGDGTPDECQPDCNGNSVADPCDIAGGTSPDCNSDGVPDECQLENDCNANGVPDDCDLSQGTSTDCNVNGVLDECDLASGASFDCNGNVLPDECDIAGGSSLDCQPNGIPDECDIAQGTSADLDENSVPDECQATPGDCNGNGQLGWGDLPTFCFCLRGPDLVYSPTHLCNCGDTNGDHDVDLADFGMLQRLMGVWPGTP